MIVNYAVLDYKNEGRKEGRKEVRKEGTEALNTLRTLAEGGCRNSQAGG